MWKGEIVQKHFKPPVFGFSQWIWCHVKDNIFYGIHLSITCSHFFGAASPTLYFLSVCVLKCKQGVFFSSKQQSPGSRSEFWKFRFSGVFVVCGSENLKFPEAPAARENSQKLTSGWQLLFMSEHQWKSAGKAERVQLEKVMWTKHWFCFKEQSPKYQPKESAVTQA